MTDNNWELMWVHGENGYYGTRTIRPNFKSRTRFCKWRRFIKWSYTEQEWYEAREDEAYIKFFGQGRSA